MLIEQIKQNLDDLKSILLQLSDIQYIEKHPELSHASIGEHTRHILEHFICLIDQYDDGVLNYDIRKRDKQLQSFSHMALQTISTIRNSLQKDDKDLLIQQGSSEIILTIKSNYQRELLYNLEHCIHHQALIKVVLFKYPSLNVSSTFGVARSTLEYREKCVQ